MGAELVSINAVRTIWIHQLPPKLLNLTLFETFRRNLINRVFKVGIRNRLSVEFVLSSKVDKELEHWIRVREGAADDALQLDEQLVRSIEGLEAVSPVVEGEIAFSVWVKLWEQSQYKWFSQIKAFKSLFRI